MKKKKTKHDGSKRCLKYIERNDLPRLKSYIKKHKFEVNHVKLDGDNTLLHAACRLGYDAIVNYLLKKGADCMVFNAEGNLPLHLAVEYALSGHKHAYTDLVLPLICKSAQSLDVPNAAGCTCRELLEPFKASCKQSIEDTDTDSSEDEDEVQNNVEDDDDWKRRLADEMTNEYLEECDRYENYYDRDIEDTETWDQWAERIRHEHITRKQSVFYRPSAESYKRHSERHRHEHLPKRPKISEEKQRAFEENMKKETAEQKEALARIRAELHQKAIESYELLCDCLFSDKPNGEARGALLAEVSKVKSRSLHRKLLVLENRAALLQFADIPWPVKTIAKLKQRQDVDENEVIEFLFEGTDPKSETYKQRLKKEQRKWHPDRFLQKCGMRLNEKDKESIIDMVTRISQVLNKISNDYK